MRLEVRFYLHTRAHRPRRRVPQAVGRRSTPRTLNTTVFGLLQQLSGDPTAYQHIVIIRNGRRVPTKVRTVFAYVYNVSFLWSTIVDVCDDNSPHDHFRFSTRPFSNSLRYSVWRLKVVFCKPFMDDREQIAASFLRERFLSVISKLEGKYFFIFIMIHLDIVHCVYSVWYITYFDRNKLFLWWYVI